MTDAELFALGEEMLAKDQSANIAEAAIVIGQPNPNPPLSLRLSSPLIEALDRLAAAQHRKRSNLIQHVLWEYVHAHESTPAATVSPAKPRARTNGKSARPKAPALKA